MARNKYTDLDGDSSEQNKWKDKYLLSLKELEEKEQQWGDSDKNLRALITHLTNAADTSSLKLNKQLSVLRDAINDGVDARKLKKAIDEVADSILGLEAIRKKNKTDPNRLVLDLIEKIKPAGKIESKLIKLTAKIANKSETKEISPLINDVAKLLVHGLSLAEKDNSKGFLSSLLGKKDTKNIEKEPEAEVLTENIPAINEEELDLNYVVKSLIALLERLILPEDLQLRANVIKRLLSQKVNKAIFITALEQTVTITSEVLVRVRKEKEGIEGFLKQLTARLHELDKDIRETVKLREQAHQYGKDMTAVMRTEMKTMEEGIKNITNLDELKTSIQSRVIMLRNHVDDFLLNEGKKDKEAIVVIEQLKNQVKKMQAEADDLKKQLEQERQQTLRDTLTGIPNRLAYEERLVIEMADFRRNKKAFVLVVWDIDFFKKVNDTYGHAAGDQVLKLVASLLNKNMRETDFIARYGGEEFLSILPNTDLKGAQLITDKLREVIASSQFHFREENVNITLSAGFAEIQIGEGSDALFYRADQALYKAKGNGRNNCQAADGALIIENE